MEHVVVTVKRVNEARVRDILLPAHMPAGELAAILAQKLEWDLDEHNQPISYEIVAEPPGRLLQHDETLAQAGAWDGSWLVFYPQGTAPRAMQPDHHDPAGQAATFAPILRWIGLNKRATQPLQPAPDATPPQAQDDQPAPAADQPVPKYVFKRIDEDP